MRFSSLGSGSSGNATLIEARDGAHVTRVFVTHEHGDHVGCALALARRHGTALWMSEGTREALGDVDAPPSLHVARRDEPIAVGALELRPFAVPHDAREPLQLTLGDGARRLGVLTDLGSFDAGIEARLAGCDALLLECNHDRELLAQGPYPAFLKRRIGGERGHLANEHAAALLRRCTHGALRHVVAAHLSVHNNRPELAAQALAQALGTTGGDVTVADADDGCDWRSLA